VVGLLVVLGGKAVLGDGRLAGLAQLAVGASLGGAVLVLLALRLPLPEVAQIASAVRGRTGRDTAEADQPVAEATKSTE
jgi:esterase/lipase